MSSEAEFGECGDIPFRTFTFCSRGGGGPMMFDSKLLRPLSSLIAFADWFAELLAESECSGLLPADEPLVLLLLLLSV